MDIKRPVSNNNVASYRFQLLGYIKKNPILGLQSILTKGLEKKTKINATSIFFSSLSAELFSIILHATYHSAYSYFSFGSDFSRRLGLGGWNFRREPMHVNKLYIRT